MSTPFDRRILWVHREGDTSRDLVENIKQATPNVAGVILKTSEGDHWQHTASLSMTGPEAIRQWVTVLAERGLEAHLWCVLHGEDISREATLVIEACQVPGVKSMLLRVENEDIQATGARHLIARIRAGIRPDFHLGLNFDPRDNHPARIHIQAWVPHVQSLHPMVYHWAYGGGKHGPEAYFDEAFGVLVRYGLPVVPMLQTFPQPTPIPEAQVVQAGEYAFAKGAVGLTLFHYGGDSSAPNIITGVRHLDPDRSPTNNTPIRRRFRVTATRLRIRNAVGTASTTVGFINNGETVEVDAQSRTEAGGYVWWRSEQGWLAQCRVDGLQTLMIETTPGTPPYGLVTLAEQPSAPETGNAPDIPDKRFRVVAPTLNVRSQPELEREFLTGTVLRQGAEIVVDADAWTEKNGFIWWYHGAGWSAEVSLSSGLHFLDDLSPDVPRIAPDPIDEEPEPAEPAPDPGPVPEPSPTPTEPDVPLKRFRVMARTLNIRSAPGLARPSANGILRAGDEIQVRADKWVEKDGYVWWQHSAGWSAERSLDGRLRYLADLTPEIPRIEPKPTEPTPSPPPTTPPPSPDGPHRYRVVAFGLTVRDAPDMDAIRVGRLKQGDELLLDPAHKVEADGYVWRQHEQGWSAERSSDGREEFMINVDTLPLLGRLFQRHPVAIEETDWVQYYGNTSFAYRYGRRNSYHTFAQGLHSGLDYGKFVSNTANPPVFAALDGVFDGRGLKYGPNRVDVLVDQYRIIYGHIGRPANLPRRTRVSPDTVLGMVENTQVHLHLEVRYRDKYIINPLWMMPPAMAEEFTGKFPPKETEFVETGSWKRWLTPFDQPIIRLAGEIIGPTA